MPIDAPTAAIIGAAVGATASTLGAILTSRVARANSYRQHLYVKRLEAYEEMWVAIDRWTEHDVVSMKPEEARTHAKIRLYGSWPVIGLTMQATLLFEKAVWYRRSTTGSNQTVEKELERIGQELVDALEGDSRRLPKDRLLTFVTSLWSKNESPVESEEQRPPNRIGGS